MILEVSITETILNMYGPWLHFSAVSLLFTFFVVRILSFKRLLRMSVAITSQWTCALQNQDPMKKHNINGFRQLHQDVAVIKRTHYIMCLVSSLWYCKAYLSTLIFRSSHFKLCFAWKHGKAEVIHKSYEKWCIEEDQ